MKVQRLNDVEVIKIEKPSPSDKFVPSVDVLFTSCAAIFGERLIGAVLTGMGNDGSLGVREIKAAGGQVLAESEETSIVFGMPREAIATGVVDKVIPLGRVAMEIAARAVS